MIRVKGLSRARILKAEWKCVRKSLLTVHVSLVFILDESVAAWLPGPLVVHNVDLGGKK